MELNREAKRGYTEKEFFKNFNLSCLYCKEESHRVYAAEAFEILKNHVETRYGIPVIITSDIEKSVENINDPRIRQMYDINAVGTYVYYPLQDKKLVGSNAKIYIRRNTVHSPVWELFTLAHELGHHIGWTVLDDNTEATADKISISILFNVLPVATLFILWLHMSTIIEMNSRDENGAEYFYSQWNRLWGKDPNVLKKISQSLKADFCVRGLEW